MFNQTLNQFCGSNLNNSIIFTKYIYDKSLTPCGEFLFILLTHYVFIFFIVLEFFKVVYSFF